MKTGVFNFGKSMRSQIVNCFNVTTFSLTMRDLLFQAYAIPVSRDRIGAASTPQIPLPAWTEIRGILGLAKVISWT